MGKRNKRNSQIKSKPDFLSSLAGLSLEELDSIQKAAPMAFQSKLQSALSSNDTEELLKANLYLGEINKTSPHIQSVFFDPNDLAGNGKGFKDSKGALSFSTLRRMGDIYIIRAIVNTRIEQVQNFLHFSEDEQKEGYTIRRKKSLFKEEKEDELSNEDKRKIENIVKFLENGGWNEKWDNIDSFQEFVRKITFDSLTLDQLAFEIVRSRDWELKKFRAIDASLIRFLDTVDPRQREAFEGYRFKGYLPRYCMVWDDMIIHNPMTKEPILYYPWELGFGIRNKTSNIRKNGYGTSELETLVEIITWILWGMSYNGLFFKQGSQPKGFINVKNANISPSTLNEFRQAWMQTMRGVENSHRVPVINGIDLEWVDLQKCLHPESNVITREGNKTLSDLLGSEKEVFNEIWDGKKFTKARIYKTQVKKVFGLELKNRLKIRTSDNHRFLVLRNNKFEWVERKDLVRDDYVLVNKNVVEQEECNSLFYKGKEVESDLFDLIGWIIGDGYIDTGNKSRKTIHTFYHPTKEDDIIEYHLSLCEKYGINAKKYIQNFSESQLEKEKARGKFKTLSPYQIRIIICDCEFYDWFRALGFNNSKQKKNVASFLYSTKSEYRCAFLRGWFSADGHCDYQSGYRINLACSNHELQQQCRELLICEGIQCTSFEEKQNSKGLSKTRKDSVLLIRNTELFIEKIGFLQQYKNDSLPEKKKSWYIKDDAPKEYIMYLATELRLYYKNLSKEEQCLSWLERHDIQNIGKGHQKASLSKVLYYAKKIGYQLPQELIDFNMIQIKNLWEENDFVEMVDVEMYNENHQFISNGILVHNCNRDMEFNEWLKFLVIMSCSVYRIDPTELGFQFKDQAQIFGQDGQKARLQHSREKGLKPILIFLENVITKYIVSELDEDFEFSFTGIEVEDEEAQVKLDAEKLEKGMVAMQDIFQKYSGRPLDPENDIIINQVYQTAKQAEQQQQMYGASVPGESEEAGVPNDEESFSENPFDKYKSFDNNPILAEAINYYKTNLYK